MEQAKNLGQLALWLSGHLLFTLITVCTIRGGYQFYQDYRAIQPVQIDLSQLAPEERNELSKELYLLNQDDRDVKKRG